MKQLIFFKTLISGILTLIFITQLSAQDWSQWRGNNRDGKVEGFTTPGQWPLKLAQQWKVTVGTGDATPALVGNKLYVFTRQGDQEVILCLDADNGKELWRNQYQAQEVTGAAARHPGPRSSPAVGEGKIVTIGVAGIISCLDAATGKLAWREDPFPGAVPTFFTSMSPMILDGMCIAHLGGTGNGALIAYNLDSGTEKWRWSEEGPEYSSPVLTTVSGTKQIVTLSEKSIVGINAADGKKLWLLPFVPQSRAYNAATPIVDGQRIIYTGAGRGTGMISIEKQGNGFTTRDIWNNPEVAVQFNTPVLKDGMLFGMTNMGKLFCLEAVTGKTLWIDSFQLDRGGFAAILDVGEVMMVLPSNPELIAFKPEGNSFTELGRTKVADSPTYAHPVISGKTMYIKDSDSVICWNIQ
jgi:outer membrane protein assembly factor BamB